MTSLAATLACDGEFLHGLAIGSIAVAFLWAAVFFLHADREG